MMGTAPLHGRVLYSAQLRFILPFHGEKNYQLFCKERVTFRLVRRVRR